ncbi:nucleotidyltransferase domain-containing protein [Candidatus Woesearchaeota archaeon]|nr:nucleotidyltransferase domain-containing protein [Candidatus Woesearchaeota archaeon]
MAGKNKQDQSRHDAVTKKNMEHGPSPEKSMAPGMENISPEAKEKLEALKKKLEKFKNKLVAKFDNYIAGVALMPPAKTEDGKKPDMDTINVLVLVDDNDSQKMSKQELKDKLDSVIQKIAKDIDKNIKPQTVIYTELWQSCYDAKHELLQLIAVSAPVHDAGMLAAIKIAEVHKTMVLKKFEKYIVSYVLSGSLVRGEATETSDIDVMVIIDDTDVKKMTRAELKDKLRAIIIGMGIEAGEMTGIRNKLNIQVYILTDFWDSLKEANPIIFTLLRDGVPFYDRGLFMPWKQMLKMGKIKPSQEAIDMFMSSGEQMLKRVDYKIKEIGMEDIYYAILTPSQAALMLFGIPPPAPRETAKLMREIFVKKENLLEERFVDILEKNIKIRKELEHGTKEKLTGKEVDELLTNADRFLKRIERLFKQIEAKKEKENIINIYDNALSVTRDVLKLCGHDKVKDSELEKIFNEEVICAGMIPKRYQRTLKDIISAKKDYDAGKLSKTDIESIKKQSNDFLKYMIEHIQRQRGRELDRAKIRVKHGDKYGEVILLGKNAFIIHDIDNEEKEITTAELTPKGDFEKIRSSTLEELEKAIVKPNISSKVFIKEKTFENLKAIFGKDVEILVNF